MWYDLNEYLKIFFSSTFTILRCFLWLFYKESIRCFEYCHPSFIKMKYVAIAILQWGWSGGAKVLCILHHWGVQLILAYSWARPAILVVGKGRGGMFLFLLFLHFHSCSSFFLVPLSSPLLSLLSLFSLSLGDDTKWPSRVDVSLNPNTIKCYPAVKILYMPTYQWN